MALSHFNLCPTFVVPGYTVNMCARTPLRPPGVADQVGASTAAPATDTDPEDTGDRTQPGGVQAAGWRAYWRHLLAKLVKLREGFDRWRKNSVYHGPQAVFAWATNRHPIHGTDSIGFFYPQWGGIAFGRGEARGMVAVYLSLLPGAPAAPMLVMEYSSPRVLDYEPVIKFSRWATDRFDRTKTTAYRALTRRVDAARRGFVSTAGKLHPRHWPALHRYPESLRPFAMREPTFGTN